LFRVQNIGDHTIGCFVITLFEIDYYASTINHFYFIYSTHIHKMAFTNSKKL